MSERDEDAVVERMALAWGLPRPTVKGVLGSLRPGNRLPGGLVVRHQGKTKTVKAGSRLGRGLVVVPVEPTEAMLVAGWPHFAMFSTRPDGCREGAGRSYRAMIRAASEEPKP